MTTLAYAEDEDGGVGMNAETTVQAKRPFLRNERPLFFAHRGGSLLAPENTLAAFERGHSYGADVLELDVHTTRDGEWVVIHDDTLDRTTDATGQVRDRTLEELKQVDAGYRFTPDGGETFPFRGKGVSIPTLREVFERFPSTRINIEFKDPDTARIARLVALLREYEREDTACVGSFHQPMLNQFRALAHGRIATSAGPVETRRFLMAFRLGLTRLLRPAYDSFQVPVVWQKTVIVTPKSVRAAHSMGVAVQVWTVNDADEMRRLLDWGVDGLMSDRPDLLADVLRERYGSLTKG